MMQKEECSGIHPVLGAFLKQCDCDSNKAHLALRVYLNLAEVRGWRDVNIHYCKQLQMPFITGRPTLGGTLEASVPLTMDESLSHQQIRVLFTFLSVEGQSFERIMLAICAPDTSIVYYSVSNNIVKPEPPETSDARKNSWQLRASKRRIQVANCVELFSKQQECVPQASLPR